MALVLCAAVLVPLARPAPPWLGWSDRRGDRDRQGAGALDRSDDTVDGTSHPAAAAAPDRPTSSPALPTTGPATGPAPAAVPPAPAPGPVPPAPPPPPPTADAAARVPDPGGSPGSRVQAALQAGVPGVWLTAVPVRLALRPGSQSRSYTDGLIEIAAYHASGPWDRLVAIVAHEFAHQVAFRLGSGAYLGAAPARWAPSGPNQAERWADCAATAFTGVSLGSYGHQPCSGASLDTAVAIVAAGPA